MLIALNRISDLQNECLRDSFVKAKELARSFLLSRVKCSQKLVASLTWLTLLCMLFFTSSKVLERRMSWVYVYIPHLQPMSSFFGLFRNRMMSLVLIYSRCGKCCTPPFGGVEELQDTRSHNWWILIPQQQLKQYIFVNLGLRKDSLIGWNLHKYQSAFGWSTTFVQNEIFYQMSDRLLWNLAQKFAAR